MCAILEIDNVDEVIARECQFDGSHHQEDLNASMQTALQASMQTALQASMQTSNVKMQSSSNSKEEKMSVGTNLSPCVQVTSPDSHHTKA